MPNWGYKFWRRGERSQDKAVRFVECWNKLPESIKTAENGESFKRRLRGNPE
jgi:hypothetical protein